MKSIMVGVGMCVSCGRRKSCSDRLDKELLRKGGLFEPICVKFIFTRGGGISIIVLDVGEVKEDKPTPVVPRESTKGYECVS